MFEKENYLDVTFKATNIFESFTLDLAKDTFHVVLKFEKK